MNPSLGKIKYCFGTFGNIYFFSKLQLKSLLKTTWVTFSYEVIVSNCFEILAQNISAQKVQLMDFESCFKYARFGPLWLILL